MIRTGWVHLRQRQLYSTQRPSVPLPVCWQSILFLYDMCFAEETVYPMDTWDEKITDSLNYLFLLKAIVKEGHTN